MSEDRNDTGRLEEIRLRLLTRIAPNSPADAAQQAAFDRAVLAQAEYELAQGGALEALRRGVRSFSIGSYSETYGPGDGDILCPVARALLERAGLLHRAMPVARRLP